MLGRFEFHKQNSWDTYHFSDAIYSYGFLDLLLYVLSLLLRSCSWIYGWTQKRHLRVLIQSPLGKIDEHLACGGFLNRGTQKWLGQNGASP